ncbi:MAG TPA: dihydroorotase [Candidatus Binataceae bacterium]|nr:dihydroorotase [Candidatus Binataceae bacterium]
MLLRGGRVIDPLQGIDDVYDVEIADAEIESCEPAGALPVPGGIEVLDCRGLWVVPGLIDPHVHLRDPGFPEKETIETGLAAAAAGGFTAVAAMANTSPVNDTPEIARYMIDRARDAGGTRLLPVSAVTIGSQGSEMVDFAPMVEAGARLLSDDGVPIDDQAVLLRAFDEARRAGFAISLHEEDRALTGNGAMNAGEASKRLGVAGIPPAAESDRVRRDLALALGSEAPVHLAHVSTAATVEYIRAAKKRGANLTCEVTPHHFTLDDAAVLQWGPNARMAPPLRGRPDIEALWAAMADGTIDMIATDHAPHDPASKMMDRLGEAFASGRPAGRLTVDQAETLAHAANGVIGMETALGLALGLVRRGVISAARMVEMMSLNPARLLRMSAHGTLAAGASADLTIIDPELDWTVDPQVFKSKSRNTPFTGMRLKGKALITIVAGRIVFDSRAEAGAR